MKGATKSKWSGSCRICLENKEKHVTYKDILGTSSNFCSHLRKSHSVQYQQFQENSMSKAAKGNPLPKGQQSLTQMFAKQNVYAKTDSQQVKITESYVEILVIKNMLPKRCGPEVEALQWEMGIWCKNSPEVCDG